jgi:starch synthase
VHEIREILSAATAFVCPSVYEPLGIVNLEAMACGTAVVASDVGGIPEVVDDGVTGTLVHYDADDPRAFETGLAEAVNALVRDPAKAAAYGTAGRQRCIDEFSWARIAEQTLEIYRKVLA